MDVSEQRGHFTLIVRWKRRGQKFNIQYSAENPAGCDRFDTLDVYSRIVEREGEKVQPDACGQPERANVKSWLRKPLALHTTNEHCIVRSKILLGIDFVKMEKNRLW